MCMYKFYVRMCVYVFLLLENHFFQKEKRNMSRFITRIRRHSLFVMRADRTISLVKTVDKQKSNGKMKREAKTIQ